MEMVKKATGAEVTHIPYKGSGPALIDVIAGHVPVMFDSVVSSSAHVKAGKLRALAVTTSTRLPTMPDVPTIAEAGLPGFDVFTWTALYTPPGVAPDRVEKLRLEVARILKLPDIMERFAAQGAIIPETMTQAQAAAFIDADIAGYRKFILEANIKPE
jgi:tripartite-type tricarboxylate transporter receptor subunit TctC